MMLLDTLNATKRKDLTLKFCCFYSKNIYDPDGLNMNSKNSLVCITLF